MVRERERGPEVLEEMPRPGVLMRLEGHEDRPAGVALPHGAQHGADLGRVVRVVVDQLTPLPALPDLEAPLDPGRTREPATSELGLGARVDSEPEAQRAR